MGGKRSDQYQIDVREAGATDYKDRQLDEKILTQDKQEVSGTRKQEEASLIPRRGKNPALAELQAKRDAAAAEQAPAEESEQAAEEGAGGSSGGAA